MNQKAAVFLITLLLPIFLMAQEDLPQGTELLTNNYFDDGLNNWELYSLESSRADYELDTTGVITGKNSVHIIVYKPYGSYPSGRIQLNQHNIPGGIVAGNSYYISFKLKANVDIEECFWTIYKEPDYSVFYDWEWIKYNKSNGVKSFSYTFIASETDTSVYFAIDLASFKKDNVELWIDDIHFIALPDPVIEPPLPLGGIELLSNNYFDDGMNKWELNVNQSDDASYNLDSSNVLEGKYCGHVRVNNTFDNGSQQTQFYQKDLLDSVKAGSKYHIQFIAKSNKTVSNLFWSINQQNEPKENIYTSEFSLPANEIVFVVDTIVSFASDELVSWSFDLGTVSEDSVDIWFDAIHLIELIPEKENVFPPETVWQPIPPETLEKPRYLQSVRDPKYGVYYTCISDPAVFGVDSGSIRLLHGYAKIQSWNCDMTKIILGNNHILNADDYRLDKVLPYLYECRWSSIEPKVIFFCSGDEFKKIDIETEQITTLHTFPGYRATIGPWEGNIDASDKYVVITNESGGVAVEASLYDIELDSVISTKSFSGDIDWISVPPSGDYIVVNNRGENHIEVYDRNFNFLINIGIGSEHGDFGVDSEGNEVWVQVIPLSMARLSDGKYTRLLQPNIGGHVCGRGCNNPGWALVSTDINIGGTTGYYYATQLFEIKLDGSGTIRHFGYARSSCTTYDNYPMGSVSPDGKKVIFNSDWKFGESTGGDAVAFISEYVARPTGVDESERSNRQMTFELEQNYPNPFNPTTTINYTLRTEGMTKLAVYNILGQEVKVLINENMKAGSYSTPFDGSNLSSGMYFYKLQSNNQVEVKKMLLLK